MAGGWKAATASGCLTVGSRPTPRSIGFAPEREELPEDIALAYAKILKAPPKPAPLYERGWTVWGAGFGGSNRTSGDLAVIGSHDLSASTAGYAGGLDYHLSRDSVVGFALAGGGLTLPRRSLSPITGCPPTALPWATI
jgi:hypothetical protein